MTSHHRQPQSPYSLIIISNDSKSINFSTAKDIHLSYVMRCSYVTDYWDISYQNMTPSVLVDTDRHGIKFKTKPHNSPSMTCQGLFFILTFYSLPVTWCTNSLTFNNCTFCPHCIYVFCIYLKTNSELCHLQHKLIGFYNRDEKCLLRGTNWVFK